MADFDSSLPIRTDGAGDVIVKVADATVPSQQLTVEADGSINVNAIFAPGAEIIITDGTDTVEVNADGSLNAVVTATDLDIRDLSSAQDSVEVLQATHDDLNLNANLQVGDADVANGNPVPVSDAGGSLTVDAADLDIRDLAFATDSVDVSGSEVSLDAGTLAALESITVQNGAGASAVNIQDGGNTITVDAADLDIRDLDAAQDNLAIHDAAGDELGINADGSINVVVLSEQDGTEVVNYTTSASVGSGASVNHDYTVPGSVTFYGQEAWMSASGKIKVQLLINAAVKWVGFNSTANPNIRIPLEHLAKAAATQVVRITITNLDNQSQDVYSTLLGVTK